MQKHTIARKFKEFFIAFLKFMLVGMIAGLLARRLAFPIMGFLHNKFIEVITADTVDIVYFWIGQIAGSLGVCRI